MKKLTVTLLLIMLGLASWDALEPTKSNGDVHATFAEDGVIPPKP